MSNYTKTSEYWLKKRRISNEKKFARKRPVEKARILQAYLRSALRWIGGLFMLLVVMAISFQEMIFAYMSLVFFLIWGTLFVFYMRRKRKLSRYQSIAFLQAMDPFDFEEYVLNMYNRLGFKLKPTPPMGDDGADGIGKDPNGSTMILQVKRYSDQNMIGSPQVRDFIGSMAFYGVKHGIFLTTGYFTKPALTTISEVGSDLRIELVDKDDFLKLLERAYPRK